MDFSSWLVVVWNITIVVLGINALIIVHELGHFLVARACGVRCDKFYIWFDFWGLRFFRFRWGETEYGLGVFPLGGYVKMLGQEDNPGELAAELERAKAASTSGETSSNGAPANNVAVLEAAVYSPDSYLAKSVPQRMAIISAGVIMNFFFAFVCATIAYSIGFSQVAPSVGGVIPGSPAWQAGLEAGDHLDSVGDQPIPSFGELRQMVLDAGGKVPLTWSRPSTGEVFSRDIFEQQSKGDLLPSIGVLSLRTLDIYPEMPVMPSAKAAYPESDVAKLKSASWRVTAINSKKLDGYADFLRIMQQHLGEPVACSIKSQQQESEITLPAVAMKTLGVRFAMGVITAVRTGSAAEVAGVAVGETIIAVDEIAETELDPLRLPYQMQRWVNAGRTESRLTLRQQDGTTREVVLQLRNDIISAGEPHGFKDGMELGAVGLVYAVPARLATGERVTDIVFRDVDAAPFDTTSFSRWVRPGWFQPRIGFAIERLGEAMDIPCLMLRVLQECETGTAVQLFVDGAPRELVVTEASDWHRWERGLVLEPERVLLKAASLSEACWLGGNKMISSSLAVYTFLTNLGNRVSTRALGGPVAIVGMAYSVANEGVALFCLFLCLIGANLAVINLLPIPVLDGGHLVFLIYEAIFRRPPNESVQVALSYLGLFLILGLMVWALSLDLGFVPRM